ncbi:hypothetical protein EV180_004164 [Coemansia sp. RSA 518]|nr:hypothetical protein EV180_004164 [Coemansia sp. RSA 518]
MTSSPTSPTSSYSTDSETDSGSEQSHICMEHRYLGTVDSPRRGMVNEPLGAVTVTLERFDANGTALDVEEVHTVGLVVNVGLTLEDGTTDVEHLEGETTVSPTVVDNKMVATFGRLRVQQAGTYQFHVRVFNLYESVSQFSGLGPARIPSNSIFNGTSETLVIGNHIH